MLDNAQAAILPQAAESGTVVKRYAPPNQRNRSANRRKSSDRLDRGNSAGNDSEKNQNALPRNAHVPDQGDIGGYSLVNENHYSRFIALEGCSCSAASQLLNDRMFTSCSQYFSCGLNNPLRNDIQLQLAYIALRYSDLKGYINHIESPVNKHPTLMQGSDKGITQKLSTLWFMHTWAHLHIFLLLLDIKSSMIHLSMIRNINLLDYKGKGRRKEMSGGGWSAAIQSYNNAKDSSEFLFKQPLEKPEMYSGATSSVWTQFRLPHQIMSPGPSSFGSQLDFLGELRRQMHRANPNPGFSP
ncbi:hypothetical protein Ahy_A08g037814 isoform A [Arachis hypogaea]|uniref:Uncharacterized protein n=1 Tax=Arachis hypogaea TaxID=3818 RepID=A0A445BRX0_ARAHY|nr:hypothetical protein Ahy_A08g037814 isoform A [Arachis hypogaea]